MRRLLPLLLALSLGLAACGDGGDAEGGSADVTTLQLLLFGGPEEAAGYEAMAAELHEANPDLRLEISPVANQDDLLARLSTSFAADRPPDLFLINFRKFGQFAEQGGIVPVGPYLEASEALSVDDFVEPPLEAFTYDGQLTCQPQNVSNLVAYVNLDLFEAAGVEVPYDGWTWSEFLAAAKAMTGDGTWGLGTEPSVIRVAPFVWSNGGEVVDDPEAPTALTLDDGGPAREALDFFLDLSLVHGVVPPDAEEQSEDAESRFLRGGLGMYLNSRKSTPVLRTIEGFEWDVVPLPVADDGGTPVTMLHSDAYCIAAGTGNEDAAWRVIEFAMGDRGQEILAESGRTVPSKVSVLDSPVFLEPDLPPATSTVFADNARIARATPNVPQWASVEKAADDILTEIFYGRIDREAGIDRLVADTAPLFDGS